MGRLLEGQLRSRFKASAGARFEPDGRRGSFGVLQGFFDSVCREVRANSAQDGAFRKDDRGYFGFPEWESGRIKFEDASAVSA